MKELSLTEYLKSPCSVTSIPYWKQKGLVIPENMKIVHDKDFAADKFSDYIDEPYFRLYHDLKSIGQTHKDSVEIVTATPHLTDNLVEIINASYDDLSVTKEQIKSYMKTPVYNSDLWILLKDKKSGKFIGSGIADYDKEANELILEWIQVLPLY